MIVCTQRSWGGGEKRSQRRGRKQQGHRGEEMLWESSLCRFHTSFLLSLLPFPVPEELLHSSARTPRNSFIFDCVYFPAWSAEHIFMMPPLRIYILIRVGVKKQMILSLWAVPRRSFVDHKMHMLGLTFLFLKSFSCLPIKWPCRNKWLIWLGQHTQPRTSPPVS